MYANNNNNNGDPFLPPSVTCGCRSRMYLRAVLKIIQSEPTVQ